MYVKKDIKNLVIEDYFWSIFITH